MYSQPLQYIRQDEQSQSYLFRVPVEVQIWHDLPWVLPGDGSPHPENLPGQHPPHQTHRVVTLKDKIWVNSKPVRATFYSKSHKALKNLAFVARPQLPIPHVVQREDVGDQAFLFSTHSTPRTARTKQQGSSCVCKDSLLFYTVILTLLLQGMEMSTYLRGESVLHRAMVGMLT